MIVVTGTGIVSAIGTNTPEVAHALLADTSGIAPVRFLETQHRQMPVGEVKLSNEQLAQRLGVPCTANTSRTMLLGTLALREALAMAGINSEQLADVALVSGTTVADMDCVERHFNAAQSNNALGDCGRSTQEMVQNVGPFGYVTTCSTACSSAANAFILGANLLRSGRFKQVVVGGTECLSRFHFNGFRSLMILDGEPCRPFDDTRAGLNLGEGAAFVVLETAEHAAQRGVEALAELSGWGNACDAFHQTASSDDGIGAVLSMRQALK
ncbi:MAG: beta-ketoacyl synthase N-terminal-like domain-containing protein, partial [Prevotella sp.]